jgi:hypothetical protein
MRRQFGVVAASRVSVPTLEWLVAACVHDAAARAHRGGGESFPRGGWVAVPQALRARRAITGGEVGSSVRRRAISTLQQLHSGALVRRHHHASAQAAAEGGAWTAEG